MRFRLSQRLAFWGSAALGVLSVGAWMYFARRGLVTSYSDAMSHLNIARLVIDNQQPGLAQLGSVWLPFSHLVSLPFIWHEWLWHSGLAGSIASMAAFVATAVGLYLLVIELTKSRVGAVIAATVFALNLNMLYMQATPLTESLYVGLMVMSILFLVRYFKTHDFSMLLLAALFSALQIVTRYDGWFVVGIEGLVLIYYELRRYRQTIRQALGNVLLFALPQLFAVGLWLLWNLLIFGDPLYAFVGPYSARAQQEAIEASTPGGLITKYDLWTSIHMFVLDIKANIGLMIIVTGVIGWITYLGSREWRYGKNLKTMVLILLTADIIFNILALYMGFSIVNVPEMGWGVGETDASHLFNARYGVLALPFFAVGLGLLLSHVRRMMPIAAGLAISLVVMQGVIHAIDGLITVQDGVVGSSAFRNGDVAEYVREHARSDETVLLSLAYFNPVMFKSGLDLKQFVHEGVSAKWGDAISNPQRYANWIVMANGDVGDPLHHELIVRQREAFLKEYRLAYAGAAARVYERRR